METSGEWAFPEGCEIDASRDDPLGWEFLKDFNTSLPLPRSAMRDCWFSRVPRDTHIEMGVDLVAVPQTLLLQVWHFPKGNTPQVVKSLCLISRVLKILILNNFSPVFCYFSGEVDLW